MRISILLEVLIISCLTSCVQMKNDMEKSSSSTTKIMDFNKSTDALELYKGAINVKNFGAVGDGVHDDTEAINKALHATQLTRRGLRVGGVTVFKGGSGDTVTKAVVFPQGIYKISDTLIGYREMRLQGIGKAVIKQVDPKKDLYYQHGLYRTYIDNLGFEGGKNQLRLWTRNNNAALIFITNCRFYNSSQGAIRCFSYTKKRLTGKTTIPIGPYEVKKDDKKRLHIVKEYDVSKFQLWANSTMMAVSGCLFDNCMTALNVGTDGAVLENCKILANPKATGPIMICRGKFDIRHLICEALKSDKAQYWIKADTKHFSCRNSTFRSAKPMCLIKFDRKPWYESNSMIVDDCTVNNSGCKEGGMVELSALPNAFYFTNNREMSGEKTKAVIWNMPKDKEIFKRQKYFKHIDTNSQFNFCVSGNGADIDEGLPEIANPYIRAYPSQKLMDRVTFDADAVFTEDYSVAISNPVFAVDFGVVGDGKTDDSGALQKAFDAAAVLADSAVILPAKMIMLAKTVKLPPRTIITSAGTTYFVGDGSVNAFSGIDVKSLFASHIAFKGFLSAFDLRTDALDSSQITFHSCIFYNCVNSEIKLISGEIGEPNKTIFQVKNCLLNARTMVETNALYSKLSNIWLQGSWVADNQAYVINRGGSMLVESVLSVPQGLKGRDKIKTTGEIVKCQYGDNMRWFDNYGKLVIKDMRYGGEAGGFCAVRSFSKKATLYMEGGATTMENKYTEHCYVYFVKPAENVVFIANNNIPGPKPRRIWIKSPTCEEIKPKSVFISGPGVGMPVKKNDHGVLNASWK